MNFITKCEFPHLWGNCGCSAGTQDDPKCDWESACEAHPCLDEDEVEEGEAE